MEHSELTPERAAVLAVVEDSEGPIGPKEIHGRLNTGSSYPSVKNLVRELLADGFIAKRGHGKYVSLQVARKTIPLVSAFGRPAWGAEAREADKASPYEHVISFVIDYGNGPCIGWDVNSGRFVQVGEPGVLHATIRSDPPVT